MLAVEVKDLSFVYSKKTPFETKALDGVSFCVEEGELVGIVGETGSGKSTLIRHLNGLEKVQSGTLNILGRATTDKKYLKELRFNVGMVFQYPEYQLFADTVRQDVAFGPKNMKLDKEEIDRRVRRSMSLVGLDYDTFAERSPFELSGGEKRRAAIAGVIAMEPKILILDEPTAGLDPVGRKEILSLVKRLKDEVSPTVIIVGHNMDEIAATATRVIALSNGKIVEDGTPEDVFASENFAAKTGLDVPFATKIADEIRKKGFALEDKIVTEKQLADALGKLKKCAEKNECKATDKNTEQNTEQNTDNNTEKDLVKEDGKGGKNDVENDDKNTACKMENKGVENDV